MLGRVTQGTMTAQLLGNINKNLKQAAELQEKMGTGRKINRPSDDPVGITYSLRYRSELSINNRFQTNVNSALSWLDFYDTILSQAVDVLKRVKELAVQGANGTNPQVALDNIAGEVEQMKDQLVDVANSMFQGKYVFSGQMTEQMPYPPGTDPKTVLTDQGSLDYIINTGIRLSVNLIGNNVFGYPPASTGVVVNPPNTNEEDNVFYVLDQIINSLRSGDHEGVAAQIPLLESRIDKILTQRAEVGARVNRIELMEQRLKDLNLNLVTLQSKTEDADLEELIIQSKVNESVYQASLAVGAKIIMPTLVDFLK